MPEHSPAEHIPTIKYIGSGRPAGYDGSKWV